MTKRRCVPRKKLGSKRIDLPLPKKKEYLRRIITLKQPYSAVRKIYMKEFGKDLNHNTFLYWRKTGAAILDPKFRRGGEPVGTPTGSPLFVSRNKKGRTSRNCLFLKVGAN
jgi:hypothetical protein